MERGIFLKRIKIISAMLLLTIFCSSVFLGLIELMSIETLDPLMDRYNQTFLPVIYVENTGMNSGTGMIIYSRGGYTFILTAQHVVAYGDNPLVITQYSNRSYPTTILEKDEKNDLAILKMNSYDTFGRPVKFLRKNEKVLVYETIYSVGHTLGKEAIVTSGEISSLSRAWRNGEKYLTISSPVYVGSSGGPTYIARQGWWEESPTYYVIGVVSKGDGYRGIMIPHIVYLEDYRTIAKFLRTRGLHFVLDEDRTPQEYLERKRLEK